MDHPRNGTPQRLSQAVTDLIAIKGWGQVQAHTRLAEAWKKISGARIAQATKVLGIRRGVLQVAVGNSPLLSELAAYHKASLLQAFAHECPEFQVRDVKFVMKGNLFGRLERFA